MKYLSTLGLDYVHSIFQLSDGSLVSCYLVDTAGTERFRAMMELYYKNADCCLLVYDVTNRDSFEECKNYYNKKLKEYSDDIIKTIVLGNKTDLVEKRVVEPEEGANFANENNYIFMEASCKDNYNVSDAFTSLIELTNAEYKKRGIDITVRKIKRADSSQFIGNKSKNKSCC